MGLTQLFQKQEKKHSLGVCIPNSRKKQVSEKEEKPQAPGGFLVSGIFQVQNTLMVQGSLSAKALKKNGKIGFNGTSYKIAGIQVEGKDCDTMTIGEKGAIFLKAEKGKYPNIKIGDELKF